MLNNFSSVSKKVAVLLLLTLFIGGLGVAETPPETEPLNPQQVTNQGALLRGIVDNTADFPEGTVSFEIWNENEQEFQHLHTEQYDEPTEFDHYRLWDTIDFIDTGDEVEYRTRVSFDGNVMYSDTTKTFTIPETPPTVETGGYDEITDTTAELDGEIINVGDYTEWDDLEPDIYLREEGDTSWVNVESVGPDSCPDTCSFTGFASGLNPSTTYEYKAVAEVSGTKLAEGSVETFTTEEAGDFPPVIDFINIDDDDITETTVEIAVFIDSLGEYDELELFAEWRKSGDTSWESDFVTTVFEGQPPTVEEYVVDDLEIGTEYDFRFTYEYNGESGETFVQTVSTKDIIEPTVFTRNVIDITSSQGKLWGELESLGSYDEVTAVHRFRESGESDWDEVYDVQLSEPANFTFLKEGLQSGTEYEVQSVVYDEEYNEVLSLGNVKTFTTLEEDEPSVVETLDAFNISSDSAELRGELLDLGDADGFELNLSETLEDATDNVNSVAWSNGYLAIGSSDNNVYIYDTSDWSLVETLEDATASVRSVAWSNGYLATGSSDDVYIYDTSDWSLVETLEDATDTVYSVAWSSDGDYLATGGWDNNVYIYDTSDWSLVETLEDATSTVFSVDWSNGYLASGSEDDNVYVYDTSDWSLVETLEDATGWVNSVALSNDYLASGSIDDNVYIYDTSDWSLVETLEDATSVVESVDWSNGYLATGDTDGNVYIHDKSDWSLIQTLEDATSRIRSVDWSNGYLATGGWDENVYIYDVTGISKIDAFFHWRETGATEWINTSKQTLKETGIYNQTITNLTEQTEYEFRAVAQNIEETVFGEIKTFTTEEDVLPSLVSLPPTNITDTSATLRGRIEDKGTYDMANSVHTIYYRQVNDDEWVEAGSDAYAIVDAPFDYERGVTDLETGEDYEFYYSVDHDGITSESEPLTFTAGEELVIEDYIFFDRVRPAPGEGVMENFAERNGLTAEIDTGYTDNTCEVDISVYDEEDGNQLYTESFSDVCTELGQMETDRTLDRIVDREKGDYWVDYEVLVFDNGEQVDSDRVQGEFRYGDVWDLIAGLVGMPFDLLRVLLGLLVTTLFSTYVFVFARSSKVVVGMVLGFTALFLYIGWFNPFIAFVIVSVSVMSLVLFGGNDGGRGLN